MFIEICCSNGYTRNAILEGLGAYCGTFFLRDKEIVECVGYCSDEELDPSNERILVHINCPEDIIDCLNNISVSENEAILNKYTKESCSGNEYLVLWFSIKLAKADFICNVEFLSLK